MHYYRHNIGDYRRDTSHLSLLEHGVYRQMLDLYYLEDGIIPSETQWVIRRLGARTQDEITAVESVLKDFFMVGEVIKHKRCEAELAVYKHHATNSVANGNLGGRPKKTQRVSKQNLNEPNNPSNPSNPSNPLKTEDSGSAQAQTPPPAYLGDQNESEIPAKAKIPLAVSWELPAAWGMDAEALGWSPAEIIREAEKFRQYYVAGKGGGTRRGIKGWRQSWSNWLQNAEKFTPIRKIV